VSRLRVPVVVGLGRGVGTSTVAAALHAHEGDHRDPTADVVVCADPERAAAVLTDRSGRLPLLALTGDGGYPRPRVLQSRFGAVVLLPRVERWVGLGRPADELATLLGQPFDHLPRPLQELTGALRLLAGALVRSGQLTDPAPPRALRPRAVALWRGLQPVERIAVARPVLPAARPEDAWDDDTLEAAGAGRAG
jgi:hypothetical protein